MNIDEATTIAKELRFDLVHAPADIIETEDDSYDAYKDGVKQNVSFQVSSLSSNPVKYVEAIYLEESVPSERVPGTYTLQWTHYFEEEVTEAVVRELLSKATSEEEALRLYKQQNNEG